MENDEITRILTTAIISSVMAVVFTVLMMRKEYLAVSVFMFGYGTGVFIFLLWALGFFNHSG